MSYVNSLAMLSKAANTSSFFSCGTRESIFFTRSVSFSEMASELKRTNSGKDTPKASDILYRVSMVGHFKPRSTCPYEKEHVIIRSSAELK